MKKERAKQRNSALSRAWWIAIALLFVCVAVLYGVKEFRNAGEKPVDNPGESEALRIDRAQKALQLETRPMAKRINTADNGIQKLTLAFEGTPGPGVLNEILDMLQKHNCRAVFFLSAMGAAEDANALRRIEAEGHTLGSYGYTGDKHMEQLPQAALLQNLCRANVVFHRLTGRDPTLFKANATVYTKELLEAAAACGLVGVYDTPYIVSYQSFPSYEAVCRYVDTKARGSIVAVKLSEPLDEMDVAATPAPQTAKPAESQAPDASPAPPQETPIPVPDVDVSALSADERILLTVQWLLDALSNATISPEAQPLREKNGGALSQPLTTIHTTQRAISYLFYGLGNDDELARLLTVLDEIFAQATFFVTREETQTCEAQIKDILAHGHELGIAVLPGQSADYDTACSEILYCRQALSERYGCEPVTVVKQPYGTVPESLMEAASATGCTLLAHGVTAVQAADRDAASVEEIMADLLGEAVISFRRGELVYFAMNYYTKSDALLGELARALDERVNIYDVKPAGELLSNSKLVYTYPVPEEAVLPELRGMIKAGHLDGMRDSDRFELLRSRYIGNPLNNGKNNLPGFSSAEIRRLDISGRVKNDQNAVFFTFDDWGSDRTVTELLDVLEKHDAKATFYIRTNHVSHNPNLLRAIALAGHDVASHTDSHYPMASDYNSDKVYEELEEQEIEEFQQDIIKSVAAMTEVIGDVSIGGRPALTATFRPPTLAVSRNGCMAILDCGFSYVVTGELSTHDYEADSAEQVYDTLKKGVKNGGVIVMHMSDTSRYTPAALDMFFTENEKKPAGERFAFLRLSDYLDGAYQAGR